MTAAKKKSPDLNERAQRGERLDFGKATPVDPPPAPGTSAGTSATAIPLPKERPRPTFPLEAFNTPMRLFAEGLATQLQAPVDMGAMLMLAALAVALAKKFAVYPKEGHREPLCLFVMVLMESGSKKSGAFSAIFDAIRAWERREQGRTRPERKAAESARDVLAARIKNLKKAAAEGKTAEDRAAAQADLDAARAELEAAPDPVEPRLLAGDVTLEKLASMTRDQGGRMAIAVPEAGKLLAILKGKYTAEGTADWDILLNGHAGEDSTVDRAKAPSYTIRGATVTVAIMGQPSKGRELVKMSGDTGLSARFAWCAPEPIDPRDEDLLAEVMSTPVLEGWERLLTRLLDLKAEAWPDGNMKEAKLYFSGEALERYLEFRRSVNLRRSAGGVFTFDPRLKEWASKFHGLVARLAGLLHLVDRAFEESPGGERVSGDAVRRAILIGEYLAEHAPHVFESAHHDDAWAGARAIESKILEKGLATVDEHYLMHYGPGSYRKKARLGPALAVLEDYGFLFCTSERGVKNRTFQVDSSASRPTRGAGGAVAGEAAQSQANSRGAATDKTAATPPPRPTESTFDPAVAKSQAPGEKGKRGRAEGGSAGGVA
jgi:hypothetical protein